MKKWIVLLFAVSVALASLLGCRDTKNKNTSPAPSVSELPTVSPVETETYPALPLVSPEASPGA